MKLLSKEEEDAHYSAVLRAGGIGGVIGLGVGLAGVWAANRRYPGFKGMTLPFKAFLVTSTTSSGSVILAERASINFGHNRDKFASYQNKEQRVLAQAREIETPTQRALSWGRENRYTIVFSSWIAAMGIALAMVGRNKYLTTPQKVVQARVYAQALTVAILVATAALEMGDAKAARKGGWETVKVLDPTDPEHKRIVEKRVHKEEYAGQDLWKDMVEAEERRLAQAKREREEEEQKAKALAPVAHAA